MSTSLPGTEVLDSGLLLNTLAAVKKGDFTVRMPLDQTGLAGKVADTLNEVIELNEHLANELVRIGTVVGKEGKTVQRASLGRRRGSWATSIDAVNNLIIDLVQPTNEVARVIGAVANGDLSQTMGLEIDGRPLTGEFLRTAKTVNTMVDQLNGFASEVTRRGARGRHRRQARRPGPGARGLGDWKDLTDNVNFMASNLTNQVRNIATVTTAVANGDLSKKITADARGEILELKETINTMVDQLNGVRLGGDAGGARGGHRRQARRPGAGQRRLGDLEGPHRQRQLDGRKPHRPGAQHRGGDDGRGQRRPVEEDHRRRARARSWS